ncbi:Methylenetetrahydrofolate reductase, partial [Zancudomyces culisetae]
MVELCGIEVPKRVMEELAAIKDDDLQVKDYGIKYGVEMVREILEFGDEQLGLIQTKRDTNNKQQDICCEETKTLPWPMGSIREGELVRPIFWNNNQQSYIQRTNSWDEFPNGRWGDFRSPAYGELVHGMNWR